MRGAGAATGVSGVGGSGDAASVVLSEGEGPGGNGEGGPRGVDGPGEQAGSVALARARTQEAATGAHVPRKQPGRNTPTRAPRQEPVQLHGACTSMDRHPERDSEHVPRKRNLL
jgi:hypothetical protein